MSSANKPLEEWPEITVHRYLTTYRKGRIPLSALQSMGFINGKELIQYLHNKAQGDDFIKEAAEIALKDPVLCWEHCSAPIHQGNDLEQALLDTNKKHGEDEDDDEVEGKFPPLCEVPSLPVFLFLLLCFVGITLCVTVFAQPLADYFDEPSKSEFVKKFLKYASIPVGTTLFTYVHVWYALYLTFYPLEFQPKFCYQIPGTNVGFPLGWQGIIAFKGEEMARMAVRMIKQHLLTVDEVFAKLDPVRMSQILHPALSAKLETVLDEVFQDEAPVLWNMLPGAVQSEIKHLALKDSDKAVQAMLLAMRPEIEDLLDLEHLVVDVLVSDLRLCVDVFVVCGHKELAFIKNIGAVMGGVLGIAQMIVWFYYKGNWFLPVVGCLAGALTNWLALLLIFWPLYPIPLCCGMTLHGRFLKRQAEVAHAYGKLVNRHVLKVENIIKELLFGARRDRVKEIVRESVYRNVDEALRPALPFLGLLPGSAKRIERVKEGVALRINEDMFDIMMESKDYMRERFDLEYTLEFRMSRLDYAKFESLLHPIFQAEEWKLVLVGAVVGLLFGLVQVTLVAQ